MSNKYINAMRMLSLQCIWQAKQGHAGMSMSASPLTYTLYSKHINISKKDPKWFNRDRFVLSAGHGSLSIYTIFHFAGLLSIDDMKAFKTLNSKTPGHPESEHDNYVDASTGPLGQGTAMAVGMAIAEKYLATKFAKFKGLVDHYTYAVLGDGDLQEGICYEAMSLAGKMNLNKLVFLHDSNDYQLDSNVASVFTEDLQKRMESMGWQYHKSTNDPDAISSAIEKAKKVNKPIFIEVKTIIGEGLATQNSNKSHSMALKDSDLADASSYYNENGKMWEFDKGIYEHFDKEVTQRGQASYDQWLKLCEQYKKQDPQLFQKFQNFVNGDFGNISDLLGSTKFAAKNVPTRNYIKDILNHLDERNSEWLISACADLIAATNIKLGQSDFASNPESNNLLCGIREFAMTGITNGILLHGGLKTISGTFLVFSDYMKSAIRLSAMMNLPNVFIFTHDSYQVGGDGPTHQPVDQLAMLRAIPNTIVHKPCDETEVISAFSEALNAKDKTHVIIFTRHGLDSSHATIKESSAKGGYILENHKTPDITLVGSGSEIDLLYKTKDLLAKDKITAKIVSVPSLNVFLNNDSKYITEVLSSNKGIFSVEPSSDCLWYKLFKYGKKFHHLGTDTFGASMDGGKLYELKGFNPENLVKEIKNNLL